MSIGIFSVWATGILNGYNKDGLPSSYKYVPIFLVSATGIVKGIGDIKQVPARPGAFLTSLFIGIPLIVGTSFCTGTFMGKSIKHVFPTLKIDGFEKPLN